MPRKATRGLTLPEEEATECIEEIKSRYGRSLSAADAAMLALEEMKNRIRQERIERDARLERIGTANADHKASFEVRNTDFQEDRAGSAQTSNVRAWEDSNPQTHSIVPLSHNNGLINVIVREKTELERALGAGNPESFQYLGEKVW